MLARMRTQTIGALTEISFTVPNDHAESFCKAIHNLFEIAKIPLCAANDDEEKLYSIEEVFPNGSPAMALRGLRTREGITQKQFAERLGISQTRVSEMENGVRPISVAMAKRIAEACGAENQIFL